MTLRLGNTIIPGIRVGEDAEECPESIAGTLSFSGTYSTAAYVNQSASLMVGDTDTETVVLVIKHGTSTSARSVIFASGSAPSGVTITASAGAWGTSVPAGQYYACLITGVKGKINVNCNMNATNSSNRTVTASLQISYAGG